MNEDLKLYDIEAEQCILGALILNSEYYSKITSLITLDCFYEDLHKDIFKLLKIFYEEKDVRDLKALGVEINNLAKKRKLDNYLSALLTMGSSVVDVEGYCKSIKNFFFKRKLKGLATDIIRGLQNKIEVDDVYNELENNFHNLLDETDNKKYELLSLDEICAKKIIDIEETIKTGNKAQNIIETGILDFDRMFGGIVRKNLTILAARSNMGKAQPLDSNVLTNFGWKKMRDVKLGDKIIDPFGKQVEVIGIFPQGIRPCYKIKFIDREVIADENHLWEVFLNTEWKEPKILTTKQLSEMVTKTHYKNRLSIRYFNGEYGIKKDFLISPYTLGVLLGDGCLYKTCQWCKTDQDIVQRVSRELNEDYEVRSSLIETGNMNRIVRKKRNNTNIYIEELKRLNLLGTVSDTKFIPQEYMHTCRQQRLDLLNGLLDTDGSIVNKNGTVEYSTVSEVLAKQVQQLVFSLGLRCSLKKGKSFLYGVRKKDRYRLKISGIYYNELFYTQRKKSKLKLDRKIKERLTISYVEPIEPQETQCILVDSPEHLYVTDNYVSTHNTSYALQLALNVASSGKNVLFFSQEMTASEQADKILSNFAQINSMKLRDGDINTEQVESMKQVMQKRGGIPLYINETLNITTSFIRRVVNMYKKKLGKIDLIIIDHLQIMGNENKNQNRVIELDKISMDCKNIAKENDCGMILLSQLSRATEQRDDHRPQLSDLRESGGIEQNADIVMFLYRESYYLERKLNGLTSQDSNFENLKRKFELTKNQVDVTVQKNRGGRVGAIKLYFDPEHSLFTDMTGARLEETYKNALKV